MEIKYPAKQTELTNQKEKKLTNFVKNYNPQSFCALRGSCVESITVLKILFLRQTHQMKKRPCIETIKETPLQKNVPKMFPFFFYRKQVSFLTKRKNFCGQILGKIEH